MAVHTFSTKGTRPIDTEMVERIKQQCDDEGKNFSALVVKLLREHEQYVNQEGSQCQNKK